MINTGINFMSSRSLIKELGLMVSKKIPMQTTFTFKFFFFL